MLTWVFDRPNELAKSLWLHYVCKMEKALYFSTLFDSGELLIRNMTCGNHKTEEQWQWKQTFEWLEG